MVFTVQTDTHNTVLYTMYMRIRDNKNHLSFYMYIHVGLVSFIPRLKNKRLKEKGFWFCDFNRNFRISLLYIIYFYNSFIPQLSVHNVFTQACSYYSFVYLPRMSHYCACQHFRITSRNEILVRILLTMCIHSF